MCLLDDEENLQFPSAGAPSHDMYLKFRVAPSEDSTHASKDAVLI